MFGVSYPQSPSHWLPPLAVRSSSNTGAEVVEVLPWDCQEASALLRKRSRAGWLSFIITLPSSLFLLQRDVRVVAGDAAAVWRP